MVFELKMSSGQLAKAIIELVAVSIQQQAFGDLPGAGYENFLWQISSLRMKKYLHLMIEFIINLLSMITIY